MTSVDPRSHPRRASRPPDSQPAQAEDGVDLTLVRWMLSLTPEQRLRVLQDRQDALESVREASPPWTSEAS